MDQQMATQQQGQPVDMQQVAQFFREQLQKLITQGMTQEQALQYALQLVAQQFGQEAAQQLMMMAQGAGAPAQYPAPA